jgi:hypothetical protein
MDTCTAYATVRAVCSSEQRAIGSRFCFEASRGQGEQMFKHIESVCQLELDQVGAYPKSAIWAWLSSLLLRRKPRRFLDYEISCIRNFFTEKNTTYSTIAAELDHGRLKLQRQLCTRANSHWDCSLGRRQAVHWREASSNLLEA